jgi:hypothetical protein
MCAACAAAVEICKEIDAEADVALYPCNTAQLFCS